VALFLPLSRIFEVEKKEIKACQDEGQLILLCHSLDCVTAPWRSLDDGLFVS
jgi:hypothetical protein